MIPTACLPFLALLFQTSQVVFDDYDWRAIAAAQMEQESACRPLAQSPYAMGLMQFTPATARDMERGLCRDLGKAKLFNPKWSITCGVRYDRYLWERMGEYQFGNERAAAALASYNGGRGWTNRDNRVCQRTSWCDPSRWFKNVELTPDRRRANWAIKENRGYPKAILIKRLGKYKQLLRLRS